MGSLLQGSIPFSATTATIKFDGKAVGFLQNIRIIEDYSVKEVDSIGSNTPVGFVVGSYRGTVTASKAFLEADVLLDMMQPSVPANVATTLGLDSLAPVTDRDKVRATIKNVNDLITGWTAFTDAFQGKRPNKVRNTFLVSFEIEIAANSTDTAATPVADLKPRDIILLKDCVITARDITVDINQLIVMENISIKYLKREI